MGFCALLGSSVFTIVVLAAAIVYHPPPYIFGPSIFLHDPVYAPVSTEENFLIDTNGSTIPSHLIGGTFFRNGPNPVVKVFLSFFACLFFFSE